MEASGRWPYHKPPLHYLSFFSSLSLPCHVLADTPSPFVSAVVEGKDGSVVRVYGFDGCPHQVVHPRHPLLQGYDALPLHAP